MVFKQPYLFEVELSRILKSNISFTWLDVILIRDFVTIFTYYVLFFNGIITMLDKPQYVNFTRMVHGLITAFERAAWGSLCL